MQNRKWSCVCVCVCWGIQNLEICVKIHYFNVTWQVIIPFLIQNKIILLYSQPLPHWVTVMGHSNKTENI